jgi:hypothetical protein
MKKLFICTFVSVGLAALVLSGCGDDAGTNPVKPPLITSFSQSQAWTCASSTNCQDVFDVHFSDGSVVTFKATDVTGGSIVQLALYAPGTPLGGTNLFTGTLNELRCGTVTDCDSMPEGQAVSDFVIPVEGTYRFAITRDWAESCGGSGAYHLSITSDHGFPAPARTVNDKPSQAAGVECPGPPPVEPPTITDISPTTAAPGETLTITGTNFSTTAGDNTVTFTNPVSETTPAMATATQIQVVVDKDATSGPISVTTNGGTATSSQSLSVTHGLGDVFVFGGTGAGYLLTLPNPTATTQYLVIPHGVNSAAPYNTNYNYSINTASAMPLASSAPAASSWERSRRNLEANLWFEAERWENAQRVIDRYGLPTASDGRRAHAKAAAAPAATRQFYVLKTTTGNQDAASSYAYITATLRYTGTKCLVYSDNDTLATGNFSQANINEFGQKYDNSIEATNVSYFGPYSDVDGNGKLIMLVTPVVNRLDEGCLPQCSCGFIAGFFNPRDLYASPPVPAGTTNHAEIIYLLAADPTGVWDCQFPVTETASENLGTIPHEHEHLTSFSWRIFHEGGTTQVTWLEEGMAHMAEDLNGDNSSNIARGKLYRADPGAVSLEDNTAPLGQRGGIYLMLRLLADRYGTGVLKQIVQSNCTGRACIQSVTGSTFSDVLAEFLAAQYLSGTSITSDARYNYTSIDLNDFGSLASSLHAAGDVDVNGSIRRSSGDFHIFTGLVGQTSQFQFNDVTGNLGLRNVIVRIQ